MWQIKILERRAPYKTQGAAGQVKIMEKKYEKALKELFKEYGHDVSFERDCVPITNGTCEMLYVIGEGNGYPAFRVDHLEELERKYAYGGVRLRLEACVKECIGRIFVKENLYTQIGRAHV